MRERLAAEDRELACPQARGVEFPSTSLLQRSAVRSAQHGQGATLKNANRLREGVRQQLHSHRRSRQRPPGDAEASSAGSGSSASRESGARLHAKSLTNVQSARAERVLSNASKGEIIAISNLTLEEQQPEEVVRELIRELADAVPMTVRQRDLERNAAQAEVRRIAKQAVVPATGIMMAAFLFGGALNSNRYTKFVPETLCTLAVAMFLGIGIRVMLRWGWFSLQGFTMVDATVLNLFLLPIIIFQGGWSVNVPHFMSQFPYILIFALIGTILSTVFIGYGSWYLGSQWHTHRITDLRTNLAFASLISATDPVATLTTFAQLKIAERQPLLNTLVFGESMLNDAVAILLFNAFNAGERSWHGFELDLPSHLVLLFFGSIFVGCTLASGLVLLLRLVPLPGSTIPETLYVFLSAYFVYSVTEVVELSGIIATLFAGIIFKLYGTQHLTLTGEAKTSAFLTTVSRFADSGVFILCGTSTALMTSRAGIHFGLQALALCLLARAGMVLICGGMSNRLKRWQESTTEDMITWKHQFMIWLSGLRGGIGLVLALEIDEKWCGKEQKAVIINTTFFLICALLLLCGATTEPCLVCLGLSAHEASNQPETRIPDHSDFNQALADPSEVQWNSLRRIHAVCQSVLVGSSGKAADADAKQAGAR